MTENAGLRGFSRALSRALDDDVVTTLRDIAAKCTAAPQRRPKFTVHHHPVYRYDRHICRYRRTTVDLRSACGLSYSPANHSRPTTHILPTESLTHEPRDQMTHEPRDPCPVACHRRHRSCFRNNIVPYHPVSSALTVKYKGSKLWNYLPNEIKNIQLSRSFKYKLKKMFNAVFSTISSPFCHVHRESKKGCHLNHDRNVVSS